MTATLEPTAPASQTDDSFEMPLCHNCLLEVPPDAHFCPHCASPLTSHAAIDPLKCIYAEFDTIVKAARSPRNVLVLTGMLLYLSPFVILLLLGFWETLREGFSVTFSDFLFLPLGIIIDAVPLILLVKTLLHYHPAAPEPSADDPLPEGWEPDEWLIPPSAPPSESDT